MLTIGRSSNGERTPWRGSAPLGVYGLVIGVKIYSYRHIEFKWILIKSTIALNVVQLISDTAKQIAGVFQIRHKVVHKADNRSFKIPLAPAPIAKSNSVLFFKSLRRCDELSQSGNITRRMSFLYFIKTATQRLFSFSRQAKSHVTSIPHVILLFVKRRSLPKGEISRSGFLILIMRLRRSATMYGVCRSTRIPPLQALFLLRGFFPPQ